MKAFILSVLGAMGLAAATHATVGNPYDLEMLFVEQQYRFLPIGPPSEDVLVQPYGPVLSVDWKGFPEEFTKQMYAEMDANGFPLYRIFVYEDPVSRETVFLNSYGMEAYRLEAEEGYDPYAWQAAWFNLESGQVLDEWSRWIYDPAHIAARFTLIPEVFYADYAATQEQTAMQALAIVPAEMMDSLPDNPTNLLVAISATNGAALLEIGWPTNFTDGLEIFATTNLLMWNWQLVETNISTAGTNLYAWPDPETNLVQRFYLAANADYDADTDGVSNARETYLYGTDPSTGDTDADGLADGEELFSGTDGYLTNPLRPDGVDYALPDLPDSGPVASLSGFVAFAPPTNSATPAANTPVISAWMPTANRGECVTLAGSGLSAFSGGDEGMDSRFLVFGQSGDGKVLADAQILRLEGQLAALRLPDALPPDGMYLAWPRNAHGWGTPFAINRTEAWWVGPDRVSTGETFSVFGRNLSLGGEPCGLYIEEEDAWLESTSASPYKADFILPSGLSNGTYTLWAHNGSGQSYGWSKPLQLNVRSPIVWDGPITNVMNFGAVGNGNADDTDAIRNAIDAVGIYQDYGTVYFPTGTYLVSGRFDNIDSRIRLLGEGATNTIITTDQEKFDTTDYGMIHDTLLEVEFRGIGFESGTNYQGKLIMARSSEDVSFVDCRFSQLGVVTDKDLVDVSSGCENIRFEGCTFEVSGNVYCGGAQGLYFKDCTFSGLNDVHSLLVVDGARQVSIAGCSARSYDDSDPSVGSGWAMGRFVKSGSGTPRNIHIAGNTTTNLCPRYDPAYDQDNQPVNQNSGEQILFEGLETHFRGTVQSATSNTVQCLGLTNELSGSVLVVSEGRGFGQGRIVASVDVQTGMATLDCPWLVEPEAGSRILVGSYASRIAVVENRFDGDARAADPHELLYGSTGYTNYTASCGVSFYGGTLESVVAGNTIADVRTGIANWSLAETNSFSPTVPLVQPNYFNLFADNTIDLARTCLFDGFVSFRGEPAQDVAVAGSVWHGNTATNLTGYALDTGANYETAWVEMNCFEGNRFESDLWGIDGLERTRSLVLYGNAFRGGTDYDGIMFSTNHVPVLKDNRWTGFSASYAGFVPGAVPALPVRAVELSDTLTNAVLDVWNTGTSNLAWTASTTSAWITVSQGSGTVPDEGDTDLLAFHIDPSAIPAGVSNGTVAVVGNGHTNKVGVSYEQ